MKVICDTYTPAGEPIPTNKRHRAAEIFSNQKVIDEVPWYASYHACNLIFSVSAENSCLVRLLSSSRYGIEQEYTLLQTNVKWPLGWPVGAYPGPQVSFVITTNYSIY